MEVLWIAPYYFGLLGGKTNLLILFVDLQRIHLCAIERLFIPDWCHCAHFPFLLCSRLWDISKLELCLRVTVNSLTELRAYLSWLSRHVCVTFCSLQAHISSTALNCRSVFVSQCVWLWMWVWVSSMRVRTCACVCCVWVVIKSLCMHMCVHTCVMCMCFFLRLRTHGCGSHWSVSGPSTKSVCEWSRPGKKR